MRDEEKWRCPWCAGVATQVLASLCDARRCACGALGIGAPTIDWDEVTDEALNLFAIDARPASRGFDAELRLDIARAGVDSRPGVLDPDLRAGASPYRYTWFRRTRSH